MYEKHIKNSFYSANDAERKQNATYIHELSLCSVLFDPFDSHDSRSHHVHKVAVLCVWVSTSHEVVYCCELAWHQAPPLLVIKLRGWCWGEGLGSWADYSRTNTGMQVLVLDFNNCQLSVIKVNNKNTDRAIDRSLEVLGLAITLKERQRQAVDGNNVFITMPTSYGKSYCYMLLPVVFEQLQSTFNHHRRLSIDSADYGTGLHKTDASWLR